MHLRFKRDALDQVNDVGVGDLIVGFVYQAAAHGFHHVGAEGASLQARRGCHQDVKVAPDEFLDVLGRGRVGDDDFAREVVRQVRPDGWRGVQPRERVIKAALYGVLQDVEEVERIFLIIKAQTEY